jgi:hypothetical protein
MGGMGWNVGFLYFVMAHEARWVQIGVKNALREMDFRNISSEKLTVRFDTMAILH